MGLWAGGTFQENHHSRPEENSITGKLDEENSAVREAEVEL